MVLADFFADGDDDALPTDHGAEAESERDGDFDPQRNKASRAVNVGLVILQNRDVGRRELRLATFLHDAKCFAGEIHVVAKVADLVVGDLGEVFEEGHFGADEFTSVRIASMVLGLNSLVRMNSVTSSRGSPMAALASTYLSSDCAACCETAMKSCVCRGVTAWLSAYVVGTVPMRMSMINPMPFCPSFEPWKKLPPVQVSMSRPRIQKGGGCVPAGAS